MLPFCALYRKTPVFLYVKGFRPERCIFIKSEDNATVYRAVFVVRDLHSIFLLLICRAVWANSISKLFFGRRASSLTAE